MRVRREGKRENMLQEGVGLPERVEDSLPLEIRWRGLQRGGYMWMA